MIDVFRNKNNNENNNENNTVAQSPKEELEYNIMRALRQLTDTRQHYIKIRLLGSPADTADMRSALVSLIDFVEPALEKSYNNPAKEEETEVWNKIKNIMNPTARMKFDDIEEVRIIIYRWLYNKNITKLDDREIRDTTNIWDDNAYNGYT